jgi:hypothetical protein
MWSICSLGDRARAHVEVAHQHRRVRAGCAAGSAGTLLRVRDPHRPPDAGVPSDMTRGDRVGRPPERAGHGRPDPLLSSAGYLSRARPPCASATSEGGRTGSAALGTGSGGPACVHGREPSVGGLVRPTGSNRAGAFGVGENCPSAGDRQTCVRVFVSWGSLGFWYWPPADTTAQLRPTTSHGPFTARSREC